MLKEIQVTELRVGMFLHDLDQEPALFPGIKTNTSINNNILLQNIIKTGVSKVTIDTGKGFDIIEPGLKSLKHKIAFNIPGKTQTTDSKTPLPALKPSSIKQELSTAKTIKHQATDAIDAAFYAAKMGRSINISSIRNSVKQMAESIIRNQDALLTLGQIRHKNTYTFDHAINTCILALTFGKWKELDYGALINLGTAALLHDIGETKLDDSLVSHKGKLSESQFVQLKNHVEYSVELLSASSRINPQVIKLVQQHHERFDGSGYPHGLKGNEIEPLAQILGLTDLYDSMTAETSFSNARAPTLVLKQLMESSDELFDSLIIKQFIKCIGIYPVGSLVKLSNGCIAIVHEISEQNSLQPKVKMIYNARREYFIHPLEINLAELAENAHQLSITGYVNPNHLHINLAAFI
ncbi:MAG: HD-GYP domain-containing protein [Gammaproteobacteria bacterium]|nr:HD-GYP domain-containing protein [Gammaproteobacteria bacterium]